jgi:hypothetical protein
MLLQLASRSRLAVRLWKGNLLELVGYKKMER